MGKWMVQIWLKLIQAGGTGGTTGDGTDKMHCVARASVSSARPPVPPPVKLMIVKHTGMFMKTLAHVWFRQFLSRLLVVPLFRHYFCVLCNIPWNILLARVLLYALMIPSCVPRISRTILYMWEKPYASDARLHKKLYFLWICSFLY
jgi:hypothetical protein